MIGILIFVLAGVESPPRCSLPFRAVPTEEAAKKVAEIVIKSAPGAPGAYPPYTIKVEYIVQRDELMIYELPKAAVLGGDGLQMWISACDGKVSGLIRQR